MGKLKLNISEYIWRTFLRIDDALTTNVLIIIIWKYALSKFRIATINLWLKFQLNDDKLAEFYAT